MKDTKYLDAFATRSAHEFTTMLGDMPNPDVILRKKGLTVSAYDELLYDAHLFSCVQSRKAGVLSLEWNLSDSDNNLSKEITAMLDDLNLYQIFNDLLDTPLYGYKPLEVYWKFVNNKMVVVDVVGKPSDWFAFDDFNLLKFLHKDHSEGISVPQYKILLARFNSSYDNPYGDSVLSRCFWAWLVKKEVFKFWTKFAEKYGFPFLVGEMEGSPDQDELDDFSGTLDGLLQDGVLVVANDKKVTTLQTNQTGSIASFERLINFCNAEISKSILSQTLTTEQGDKGTQALGTVHLQVRQDVVDMDKKLVEQAMNKLIRWYVDINYGKNVSAPAFTMFEEQSINAEKATRDVALSQYINFTETYWQRHYGLKADEFKLQVAPAPMFSEKEDSYTTLDKLGKSVQSLLKPVIEAIKKGKSFNEIQADLISLFPHLDTTTIEELIGQGIMASSVHGVVDAK